jgi:hypothetical protein
LRVGALLLVMLRCGGVELGGVVDVADLCACKPRSWDQSNRMESRFPFFSLLSQSFLPFPFRFNICDLFFFFFAVADPFLSFLVVARLLASLRLASSPTTTTKSHHAYLIQPPPSFYGQPSITNSAHQPSIPSHTPKNTPTPNPSTHLPISASYLLPLPSTSESDTLDDGTFSAYSRRKVPRSLPCPHYFLSIFISKSPPHYLASYFSGGDKTA